MPITKVIRKSMLRSSAFAVITYSSSPVKPVVQRPFIFWSTCAHVYMSNSAIKELEFVSQFKQFLNGTFLCENMPSGINESSFSGEMKCESNEPKAYIAMYTHNGWHASRIQYVVLQTGFEQKFVDTYSWEQKSPAQDMVSYTKAKFFAALLSAMCV